MSPSNRGKGENPFICHAEANCLNERRISCLSQNAFLSQRDLGGPRGTANLPGSLNPSGPNPASFLLGAGLGLGMAEPGNGAEACSLVTCPLVAVGWQSLLPSLLPRPGPRRGWGEDQGHEVTLQLWSFPKRDILRLGALAAEGSRSCDVTKYTAGRQPRCLVPQPWGFAKSPRESAGLPAS